MAEVDMEPLEQKRSKSVAFSAEETLIDDNGDVTTNTQNGSADNSTAESHSLPSGDGEVDEATAAFDELALKKKKKSKKAPKDDEKDDTEDATADGEFDPAALKKKKKKKAPKSDVDGFEAKLAESGVTERDEDEAAEGKTEADVDAAGDMDEGTGVWQHDSTQPINYNLLLSRFFKLLNAHNPDLMSSGSKSYKIPPPQCLREGNKKTIFANIADICKRMKRSDEHVTQFLFAELGTNGSVDGSRRLVIKGKFLQKQIENVLRRYIMEYVTCKTCRSPDTELVRGENRLMFVNCNSCGSRRSVTAIKTGYTAQIGKRKRPQG